MIMESVQPPYVNLYLKVPAVVAVHDVAQYLMSMQIEILSKSYKQ